MSIHVRIREMLAQGELSPTRIARVVGCNPDTVYEERKRLIGGLPPGPPPRRNVRGGPWTEERVEALKKLWADGLSARQIAAHASFARSGITRNAVISKRDRLGLPDRKRDLWRKSNGGRPRSQSKPKQRGAHKFGALKFGKKADGGFPLEGEPLPPPQATDIARVSFLDLNEKPITIPLAEGATRIVHAHCKWPVLDPREVKSDQPLFCGDQRELGLPYCASHADRASNKVIVYRRPPRPKTEKIPTFAESESA